MFRETRGQLLGVNHENMLIVADLKETIITWKEIVENSCPVLSRG